MVSKLHIFVGGGGSGGRGGICHLKKKSDMEMLPSATSNEPITNETKEQHNEYPNS